MSETSGPTEGSAENNGSKRGVRGWLADLFSDEPEGIPELVSILRAAASRNLIDEDVLNIILGAVQVSELRARDIMIQRSSLVVIKEEQSIEQLLPIVVESRHSRFPVVGEDMDDVKGILHAKDLLPLVLEKDLEQFVLKNFLRPAWLLHVEPDPSQSHNYRRQLLSRIDLSIPLGLALLAANSSTLLGFSKKHRNNSLRFSLIVGVGRIGCNTEIPEPLSFLLVRDFSYDHF